MPKLLCCTGLLVACLWFSGCGGDDVAPLTEPGTDPPPEQQRNWMEESMKQGGAPKGYKPPKDEKEQ